MGYWMYLLGATVISGIVHAGINIAMNHLTPPEHQIRRCGICREELTRNTSEIQCKRKHTFHQNCVDSLRNEGQRNCIECREDFVL